jgi:hypothetical protein
MVMILVRDKIRDNIYCPTTRLWQQEIQTTHRGVADKSGFFLRVSRHQDR